MAVFIDICEIDQLLEYTLKTWKRSRFIEADKISNIRLIDDKLWCCTPDKIEVRNENFKIEKEIFSAM